MAFCNDMKPTRTHGLIRVAGGDYSGPRGFQTLSDPMQNFHSRKGLLLSTTSIDCIIQTCRVIWRDYKNTQTFIISLILQSAWGYHGCLTLQGFGWSLFYQDGSKSLGLWMESSPLRERDQGPDLLPWDSLCMALAGNINSLSSLIGQSSFRGLNELST